MLVALTGSTVLTVVSATASIMLTTFLSFCLVVVCRLQSRLHAWHWSVEKRSSALFRKTVNKIRLSRWGLHLADAVEVLVGANKELPLGGRG